MPRAEIGDVDDVRLAPYRDLKLRTEQSPWGSHPGAPGLVVAEGEKLVERLLDSGWRVESIVCTPAGMARIERAIPASVPVYLLTTAVISRLIGFPFHRGVLACAWRPEWIPWRDWLPRLPSATPALLVLCPNLRDPSNLGTILRTAAAFGAAGVFVGFSGTDPFSRRVLRTSMGSVFRIPVLQTDEWPAVLEALHAAGFTTWATVLDPAAQPLPGVSFQGGRTAIFLGNEDSGLPLEITEGCLNRVTLPMAERVDSLNVAVAAGIVIHHFAARAAWNTDNGK